ncbi:hypothetical protein G7Y89_g15647 [Cudoniella acicularis]|uniref:FAD-binding FR-type domain-containing protein n=1 Tax=Cudoniella acicularis TaxID=354080 RepID=A0A8H4VI43_9HELO|nr:hypothetical protein G7Y89_g15647 [Cudoniella acicularis]
MFIAQCVNIIYRNTAFGRGFTQASISSVNDIVQIRLELPRKLKVDGEYVGLWLWNPAVSFWSFLHIHPFVVTSWSEAKQEHLDLFIQPRRGFTQKLLNYSKRNESLSYSENKSNVSSSCLALFTGPHGTRAPVGEYETVLMVAGGFGIAAQLPYLKQLIYGYNTCKTRTRRVHLVWQLETIDILIAMVDPLNDALVNDTLDDGYILSISIYIEYGSADRVPFGERKRAIVYRGSADLERILKEEAAGTYIKRIQEEKTMEEEKDKQEDMVKREDMLVMVSGTNPQRDKLRGLVRGYLDEKVSLFELEFQPV